MKKTDQALALHLPKAVCEQLGITEATPMEMSVKNGRLVLQPKLAARVSANRFMWLLPLVVSLVLSIGV